MRKVDRAGAALCGMMVVLASAPGGCASGPRAQRPPSKMGPVAPAPDPRSVRVLDGVSGLEMTWESLVAALAERDVVILGEQHGHAAGLAAAAALFEDLAARRPNTIALSMEFYERDAQVALDDYIAGIVDGPTFVAMARREAGNDPQAHRDMVERCKALGRPVIAANAPRRYVRLARTDGFGALGALTPEQRRLFVIPESLTEGKYREDFYGLMGGAAAHAAEGEEDPLLGFYRAQNVWDATMADSIALGLAAGDRPVVQVVGQFHSDFGGGLTQRVMALAPRARVASVSFVEVDDALFPRGSGGLPGDCVGRADYIVDVGEPEREGGESQQ